MLTHPNSVPLARKKAPQLWGAKQAAREWASGKAPDLYVSFHVRLSREFSWLPQMDSLSRSRFLDVTQRSPVTSKKQQQGRLPNGEFAHRLPFPFLFKRDAENANIKTLYFCFIFS